MRFLCLAAMLIPPWNIFWWVVGLTIYIVTRTTGDDDASGDNNFLYLVLGAPIALPGFLFSKLKERLGFR